MANEELFSKEALETVLEKVKSTSPAGFSVTNFEFVEQILEAGYLVGKGRLEIVSGGGREPYVVRVKQDGK